MAAVVLKTPIVVGDNENLDASFRFWQDDEVTPTDLTGYTASFGMRLSTQKDGRQLGAAAAVLAPNIIQIDIPPQDLADLPVGTYDFEVVIIAADGHRTTKLRGKISLKEGIAP